MFDRSPSLLVFLFTLASCAHGPHAASPTEHAATQWDALVTPSTALASVAGVPSAPRIDLAASSVEISSDVPAPVGSQLSTRQFDRAEMLQALQRAWRSSKTGASTGAAEPVRVLVSAAVYHRGSEVAGQVLHGMSGYVTALFGAPLECARAEVVLVVGTQDGRHFAGRGQGSGCLQLYSSKLHTVSATGEALSAALSTLRPISADELAELVPSLGLTTSRSAGLADRIIWPALPTRAFPVEWAASAHSEDGTAVATQAGDGR